MFCFNKLLTQLEKTLNLQVVKSSLRYFKTDSIEFIVFLVCLAHMPSECLFNSSLIESQLLLQQSSAQRSSNWSISFLVVDVQRVWRKGESRNILAILQDVNAKNWKYWIWRDTKPLSAGLTVLFARPVLAQFGGEKIIWRILVI